MINQYNAYSLSDFMRIVSDIGRKMGTTPEKPPVLWFRGQRIYTWDLEPSIFRKVVIRQIKRCRFHQIKTGLSEHLTMG